jgi:acylphosphatase
VTADQSGQDPTRRHVVVRGQVQGVFFRDSCRREARGRGVAGWISNTTDGAVEAVFEGPADAVDAMVAWVHDGPPHATVAGVSVRTEQPEGLSDFQVR